MTELMRVVGVIRPTETREIIVEATTYTQARELLAGQVPEGWELLSVRRDTAERHPNFEDDE